MCGTFSARRAVDRLALELDLPQLVGEPEREVVRRARVDAVHARQERPIARLDPWAGFQPI